VNSITQALSGFPEELKGVKTAIPMSVGYEVGVSSHDRINAYSCLPEGHGSMKDIYSRTAMVEQGIFGFDVEDILHHGFRMMEVSTIYCGGQGGKLKNANFYAQLKAFSKLLQNWYFMNPGFFNGRITTRFMPEARLGVPLKYYETRIDPWNPYPKMELFYIQGVSHSYKVGQMLTTQYTVIRGLRFDLTGSNVDQQQEVASLRNRVLTYFSAGGTKA